MEFAVATLPCVDRFLEIGRIRCTPDCFRIENEILLKLFFQIVFGLKS